MARLGTPLVAVPDADKLDWRELTSRENAWFEKALANSDKVDLDGDLTGLVLTFPRGDGYAIYVVSDHRRRLTLHPVVWGNNWQVEDYVIRGLRRQDIIDIALKDRNLRALFKKGA